MATSVRIVGVGATPVGRLGRSAEELAEAALDRALADAGMGRGDLQGLIAVPSLSNPTFMQAHQLATRMGLLPHKRMIVRTIDTGGAGPITSLGTARNMILSGWTDTVAVVASDAVLSMDREAFRARADESVRGSGLPSPAIPHGYDRIAQWHMRRHGVTREQLAMVPAIFSHFAARHPDAMCRRPFGVAEVLASPRVAPVTNVLECARRADGAAALVVASSSHFRRHFGKPLELCPAIVSTGEASGPLYPPAEIDEDLFSCERAARIAFETAQLSVRDIDFFALYDCFPICFLRALEAVGCCPVGGAGEFVERAWRKLSAHGALAPAEFPFNLHGGLACFGAPWEVPAMYGVLEAVAQLTGRAGPDRQIAPKPRRALVYGNGGIFSASAVAVLGDGVY
ncbi:MAG: thiolase family protein [Planctomycetota bacterium]